MHVVVIGGAGYIGSHVTRRLIDAGHEVTVFDNLLLGLRENLFADAQFVHGDVLQPLQLRDVLSGQDRKVDGVIHLAAAKAAGESMIFPEKYAAQNISGTINVINAMVAGGVSNLVFSSSAAVYGEPEYLPIDELHPTVPINFYGYTKLEVEKTLEWFDQLKGLRSARLRYFNAAGYDKRGRIRGLERNPANLLPVMMEVAAGTREELQIYGDDYGTRDGTCIRDYIHVTDLAEAHLLALEYIADRDTSLTVNLGSESGVTVAEMVEAARRITGQPVPSVVVGRREGDPAELVASSARAHELLGWTAVNSDVDSLVETSWKVYGSS